MGKKKHASGLQQFLSDNRVMTFTNQDGEIDTLDLRTDETTDETLGLLNELPALKKLTLQDTQITDKGLAHLSELVQLEELDLRSCKRISDAGMRHVAEIDSLKDLALYDTAVGDKGLTQLVRLVRLERLNLHSTRVTDPGLKLLNNYPKLIDLEIGGKVLTDACLQHVSELPQLEWLQLGESQFSDLGLAQLGRLTRLLHLFIGWTRITGTGFEPLANLTRLESLHASDTLFSDEGLKHLTPLKSLKHLSLATTRITDKGLKYLSKLEKLKALGLDNTRVTKQGKAELKKALPRCVITISADQGQVSRDQFDEEYFWSHPPRCIAGFTLKAICKEEPTTYQIACSCGSESGSVVGFPLSNYSQNYSGSEFVSPLAFRCARCRKTTEIIDTEIHGYDGEQGASTIIRGEGKRTDYHCAKCDSNEMNVFVHFQYQGECHLIESDPTISVEDYFGWFSAEVVCVNCEARNTIADFECA